MIIGKIRIAEKRIFWRSSILSFNIFVIEAKKKTMIQFLHFIFCLAISLIFGDYLFTLAKFFLASILLKPQKKKISKKELTLLFHFLLPATSHNCYQLVLSSKRAVRSFETVVFERLL